MKVLVTGSRKWRSIGPVRAALRDAGATIVVHGAAEGADYIAEGWAKHDQIPYRGYPAQWNLHGRSAGPRRNASMLFAEHRKEEPIDLCLGFPTKDSIGTIDMLERCVKIGIKTIVAGRVITLDDLPTLLDNLTPAVTPADYV